VIHLDSCPAAATTLVGDDNPNAASGFAQASLMAPLSALRPSRTTYYARTQVAVAYLDMYLVDVESPACSAVTCVAIV